MNIDAAMVGFVLYYLMSYYYHFSPHIHVASLQALIDDRLQINSANH